MVDRLIREKLLGCGRNHEAKKNRLSLHSPTGSPNQQQQQYRAMSRSPRPQSQQEHCALGTGTSLLGQPRPQLGSPCPAITSWPAPPPRADLKPTAIAAPLLGMGGSPSTSFLRSNLVHPSSPLPSPMAPSPMAPSPQPNPHPRLELPEDNNSAQLLSMLRAMAGSTSAGTSSPGGGYRGGRETELRQKIQALEEIVAEYERQKFNVLGTFSDFRERVAERERRLEADYSSRIIDLSEEVLGAKKDFEERMKSFQLLQEQFEREKEQALEKLRQDHQREIQTLEHALEQRYIVWKEQRYSESQLLNLEQKYLLEIQRLEEERKLLRAERERFSQDFEVKLRRAESLFESELTAAKIMYTRELQALREHEEALKDELAARQEEFHERLAELQHQSRQAKDELGHCREEVTQLEWKLREKAAEIQRLAKELAIARRQAEQAARRLGDALSQAEQGQRRLEEQKAELERRAAQLEAAEETQARLEQTVKELRTEVKALRNRVELLEVERDGLRAQAESQTQLHDSQLTALEAMLESVTRDKDICAERYEDNLQKERAQAEEREASLRCEFSTKLGELEEQYNGLREHVEQESGPENEKLWEEIESLRAEKRELEDETDAAAVEKHEQMAKIAQAIGSLEKKAGMGKPADEEGKAEKKRRLERANEEGEEKEDADDQEEEEASISAEELLRRLNDLERSVEGIVREKKQTEARLQQLQEHGPEGGWTRAQELERELAEQKDRTAELEKGHREALAELQAQLTKLEADLADKGEADSEGEANKQRERADQLEKELLEAEERLEEAREAAEQELRQMEEEGALALELKISALNREHERTVELMQLREQEMAEQLELLKGRQRPETGEEQTQTELESTELEIPSKETVAVEETERLAEEMERMRQREQEREELIRQLQAELTEAQQHRESQGISSSSNSGGNKEVNRPKKENRSQSIASASDHLAFCQRTAAAAAAAASSGRSMLEELAGQQQRKECQKSGPGLLERRGLAGRMEATVPQEMSPPHHHQHSAGPSSSSQRLLSPTASAQRTSPSRQMFFAAAGKGAPTGAATEKSEKRPAWKF